MVSSAGIYLPMLNQLSIMKIRWQALSPRTRRKLCLLCQPAGGLLHRPRQIFGVEKTRGRRYDFGFFIWLLRLNLFRTHQSCSSFGYRQLGLMSTVRTLLQWNAVPVLLVLEDVVTIHLRKGARLVVSGEIVQWLMPHLGRFNLSKYTRERSDG
jgi:hypothetical protein